MGLCQAIFMTYFDRRRLEYAKFYGFTKFWSQANVKKGEGGKENIIIIIFITLYFSGISSPIQIKWIFLKI